jgi:hypothetical protein
VHSTYARPTAHAPGPPSFKLAGHWHARSAVLASLAPASAAFATAALHPKQNETEPKPTASEPASAKRYAMRTSQTHRMPKADAHYAQPSTPACATARGDGLFVSFAVRADHRASRVSYPGPGRARRVCGRTWPLMLTHSLCLTKSGSPQEHRRSSREDAFRKSTISSSRPRTAI